MEFNIPAALWCGIPSHNITCILTSPDGKSVFTGSDTGEICIWDFNFNVNYIFILYYNFINNRILYYK